MSKGVNIQVTWGGASETRSGNITIKFIAPFSEVSEFTRLVLYTGKQVFLFAKWYEGSEEKHEQVATAMYAGKSEDGDGEAIIKFKTDVNSMFEGLARLKQACVAGLTTEPQSFQLSILSQDDIQP